MTFVFVGALSSTPTFAESLPTTVSIKPSLSINIPSSTVNLVLDPSMNDFGSSSTTITVATNNPNGYKLYLSSNTTDLTNTTDSTYTIPTLASSTSEANFPANYWGYKLNSDTTTNYLPYQSDTLVSESTTATNGTSSTATFAAKVDYNKPAGLYSIAFDLKTIPIVTQTYMQDMDPNICKTDSPTIVIDSRDEQPYLIQRLDDGKCWMLDNLNLDLTNKTIVDNITTANTHVDAASLKSLKEGNRTDCGEEDCSRYATSGLALENWISGAVYSVPHVNKGGTCSTKTTYPCEYDGVYTNNTVLYTLISDSTFGLGSGKIGVYYNYCAASAGNYCYGDGGKSGTPPSAGDEARAQYDICPANWRLPTGGSDGEFRTLCTAINGGECSYNTDQSMDASDANSMQHKFSLLLSGFVSGGIGSRQGNYGVFWSSSYASSTHIFAMRADVTDINLRVNDYRYNGESVRCILNES